MPFCVWVWKFKQTSSDFFLQYFWFVCLFLWLVYFDCNQSRSEFPAGFAPLSLTVKSFLFRIHSCRIFISPLTYFDSQQVEYIVADVWNVLTFVSNCWQFFWTAPLKLHSWKVSGRKKKDILDFELSDVFLMRQNTQTLVVVPLNQKTDNWDLLKSDVSWLLVPRSLILGFLLPVRLESVGFGSIKWCDDDARQI